MDSLLNSLSSNVKGFLSYEWNAAKVKRRERHQVLDHFLSNLAAVRGREKLKDGPHDGSARIVVNRLRTVSLSVNVTKIAGRKNGIPKAVVVLRLHMTTLLGKESN